MAVQGFNGNLNWKVTSEQAGSRLESFVRQRLPHLSRRESIKAIAEQAFTVNGRAAKKGDRLNSGDVVNFVGSRDWLADQPKPCHSKVRIAYEDDDVLVIDKPAGMATHGFSGRHNDTVANFLVGHRPELVSVGNSRWEAGLVNRLDRETSGLVLAAKNQHAFGSLREQFRSRRIKKTYWALVWGDAAPCGLISFDLVHDPSHRGRMQIIEGSANRCKPSKIWQAVTRFRNLAASAEMSLLEIEMETGVTHQIRVHLAALGHAIVGDVVYGRKADSLQLGRHFLHACRIEFTHPASANIVVVESPLPAELRSCIDRAKISF
jgi:23S rRNA pseudouridine1911/1915/1917 synthase